MGRLMLTAWILSLMIALQPTAPWSDTYAATARAIDQVVQEQPSLFTDDLEGRQKTAAVLVSIAWFESTFKPNAVGGGGRFRGLYQVGGRGDQSDPVVASRIALTLVRESFRLCAARPAEERLAYYAAGGISCRSVTPDAVAKSRYRVLKAMWLVKHHPPGSSVVDDAADGGLR
jgi:hypothetical protein